ncbi:ABC transporter substrate-binding protein [Lacrimispora sphenoides]|uniref:ABC-type glycerol-3-phosphate transport system, substrate-binding protein n=1 Tax=Lacrimispora sphenoides JCM 1415 TaxID=1297793 RepID=A0ABY1CAC4_9FIRM|nr:extracellular solute-binding protein [Lacrimispora sphenoides]SET84857.1 ABC-type glycerol-3-phosphate transport system, substrate-binding protein [[Clostridium] sphenoides JCM 1415]SUY51742.1 extracellular solute-binding protein [Lacrimispora sphenoides]
MKKMKRLVSMLMCLLLVATTLVGCKKNETSAVAASTEGAAAGAPVEKFQIKLGIWPEDTLTDDVKLHEGYVKTFNAAHPNVEVIPAYYKYATDTFVSLAESGNLPTIFDTWFTEPQKLINGGFVADITDELKARGWDAAMNPSIRDMLSKDGRIYGLPRDGYALGLMLNVELFEEAGLVDANGSPQYPKTWDELAKTAKIIKDKTGQAGLCLLAKDGAGGWHFSNIAWGFGATFTLLKDGKYAANVNSPEAIAAMEYVKSLKWDYDVLTADPTNEDWGTGFGALGTGTAAMYIAANDAVNQPTQVNGLPVDKLSIVPIPAGPKGQYSLSGGTPYMFSKDATPEQINAALDYLEIMGKAPVATDVAIAGMKADDQNKVNNNVPVIPRFPCWVDQKVLDAETAVTEEYSNVDMKLYNDYFNIIKTSGNLRAEEPGSAQDLYAELTKVLQAVITDKNADIPALMKTANDNYQEMLDQKVNK